MNPTTPASLLDQLGQANLDAARERERARSEATAKYWAIVDRIATGDATGGTDPKTFAALLDTLGMDLGNVKSDVETIKRVRDREAADDAARQALEVTSQAAVEAEAAERVAAAAHAAATKAALAARWRANTAAVPLEARDSKGDLSREEVARVAARKDAIKLAERGYTGRLLRPVVEPPPRMARFIGNAPEVLCGATRRPGDVFEVPRGTPLEAPPRRMMPGEIPPPQQTYLIDADAPWPPVAPRRRFSTGAAFRDELLGSHGINEEFECEVPDGTPLPWFLQELEPLPETPVVPEPVPIETEPATPTELLREPVAVASPVDRLAELLDQIEQVPQRELPQDDEPWQDEEQN